MHYSESSCLYALDEMTPKGRLCDGWGRKRICTFSWAYVCVWERSVALLGCCFVESPPLSLCGILSEPAQWHFQAAELRDLSVSPSVVISDCYSPDNDALTLWGWGGRGAVGGGGGEDDDIQPTSRSAWLKVVFPLLHQTTKLLLAQKTAHCCGKNKKNEFFGDVIRTQELRRSQTKL